MRKRNSRTILNPKPEKLKCLSCGAVFNFNEKGESETGIKRPMCPGCNEEIDLANAGEDAYLKITAKNPQ